MGTHTQDDSPSSVKKTLYVHMGYKARKELRGNARRAGRCPKILQKIDIRKYYVDFLLSSCTFVPSLGQPTPNHHPPLSHHWDNQLPSSSTFVPSLGQPTPNHHPLLSHHWDNQLPLIMHFCPIFGTSPHAQPPLRSLASPESHNAGESKRHQHQRQHRIADGGWSFTIVWCVIVKPGKLC